MKKKRESVPAAVKEKVLREFNYLCALCGSVKPQLHHIDEDPSNSDPANLLPLCANHHITDQHNPTARIDPAKLKLFRRYKDPVILGPQFHPLFLRFAFLTSIKDDAGFDETFARIQDLIAFTEVLKMGDYYSQRFARLLRMPIEPLSDADIMYAKDQKLEARRLALIEFIRPKVATVEALIVELVRYQDWQKPDFGTRSGGAG